MPDGLDLSQPTSLRRVDRLLLRWADDRTHPPPTVLLTLDEAAAFLRTSVATLRYWRHLGVGPAGFRLGRRVLYRQDDLEQWVTDRHDAAAARPDGPQPA